MPPTCYKNVLDALVHPLFELLDDVRACVKGLWKRGGEYTQVLDADIILLHQVQTWSLELN